MTRRFVGAMVAFAVVAGVSSVSVAAEVTEAALPAYCEYERQSLEITRESQKRFMDIAKADEWAETEVRKLNKPLEAETGVSFYALLAHAIKNKWKLKCNAMHTGGPTIDGSAVAAATSADAKTAKDALESYYVFRLNSANYPLFDRSRFNAIRCGWETVESARLVGCQAIGVGARDLMGLYAVGRAPNGDALIAPVNGTAMTHIKGMPHLTAGATKLPVAAYAGPSIDIPAALSELK